MEEAPSNLAVIGRYVLHPAVFEVLENTPPGRGNEIQLTDALQTLATMAAEGAVFGSEHSAHYYFRDFFNADTGMLAAMHVLAALGEQHGPLSELGREYEPYTSSGEINSQPGRPLHRTALTPRIAVSSDR